MSYSHNFVLLGWFVHLACHTRWTRRSSYSFNTNRGHPVRSLLVLGCELSWMRAA